MEHVGTLKLQERISALADGELSADEIGPLLDAMDAEPAAFDAWVTHHAIAASIRGEKVSASAGDLVFWQSLQKKLGAECEQTLVENEVPTSIAAVPASNEPSWKVRALASFALVIAVGSIATVLWPQSGTPESVAVADVPAVPAVSAVPASEGNVMLRDPALDALMAAHQQMGGHSAWQAPSGFLRNATFERPGR